METDFAGPARPAPGFDRDWLIAVDHLSAPGYPVPVAYRATETTFQGETAITLTALTGRTPEEYQMVGMAVLSHLTARVSWLSDVWTNPQWRRTGVASRLVRYAAELATRAGCEALSLEVHDDNIPALALYELLAFAVSAKSHEDDRHVYTCRLQSPAQAAHVRATTTGTAP